MTVDELLDQIDDMIDKAWSMPLSGGKCLIEADHLRDIIDDIRGNMPSEIRQARAIVADRTDIVATAKREAEGIIRTAEERARSMVSHEEVVRQAQAKAKEILSQSQQKAREMRKGAQEFSEDVLRSAEETLGRQLTEIRQARQILRNPAPKRSEAAAEPQEYTDKSLRSKRKRAVGGKPAARFVIHSLTETNVPSAAST